MGRGAGASGRDTNAVGRDTNAVGWDAGAVGRDTGAVAAAVGAMVRAGLTPASAYAELGWREVAEDGAPVGDVPAELLLAARLAHSTGAPLGPLLDALAARARADREAELARESALAGPRLSARVLALLPAVGIALAVVVDARVLAVLRSGLGVALLAASGALTLAGQLWIRRLVRSAEGAEAASVSPAVIATALRAVMQGGQDVPRALDAVGAALGVDAGADASAHVGKDAVADAAANASANVGTHAVADAAAALTRAARALRAGVAWEEAWAGAPDDVAVLARALRLPWTRGAAAGPMLASVAEELAYRRRARATRAAGELGVRLALPLALCLLPAFVVGGVLPLLVALVGGLR